MMKVGITGHQQLTAERDWVWVTSAISAVLKSLGQTVDGISSLAIGADQIFASLILELGGHLHAVIPFPNYQSILRPADRDVYQRLLSSASTTTTMHMTGTAEDAYLAAGKSIVDMSDVLVAVWNGLPAKGKGGTADIVNYAIERNKQIIHINPINQTVTSNGIPDISSNS
jgi:hypothetical protein